MTTTENWRGRVALMLANCAGMLDLVALPVWVGTLIAGYQFDPRQAGGLVTLFLIGAVISSLFFAARFHRLPSRLSVTSSFALAALAFLAAAETTDYRLLAGLHLLAGAAAACGLSFTHGTIARSRNPHRLYAIVGTAVGVFAIILLGGIPNLTAHFGPQAMFFAFALVMALAAVAAALGFPALSAQQTAAMVAERRTFSPSVWFGIAGISAMAITEAMVFSFIERIGADHGLPATTVTAVLIALGIVNLLPAPLAGFLETRLPARGVMMAGPVCQAVLALALTFGQGTIAYAAPTMFFAGVMIFTHTFAFGILARLEPSARALAATPAMLMIGAAVGPILAGVLVQAFGYQALGIAAVIISTIATTLFAQIRFSTPTPAVVPVEAL